MLIHNEKKVLNEMQTEEIKIKKIYVKDLVNFAKDIYKKNHSEGVVPINKKRAAAHANNPCAAPDDIGLLVGYLGDSCIGYLGIMPGFVRSGNETWKIHWLTTWYVAPEYRKTALAVMLMLQAIGLKNDLVVCGMTDEAERIYKGLRFRKLGELDYSVMNLRAIDPFNLGFRGIRWMFRRSGRTIDIPDNIISLGERMYSPLRKLLYKGLFAPLIKELNNVCYKEVEEVGEDSEERKYESHSALFYRDHHIINWMIQYKWIVQKNALEEPDLKYFFSEVSDVFQYIVVKIFSLDRDDYKGFVVLSFSKKNLDSVIKVLDYHFYEQGDYKYVVPLALRYAYVLQANYIEMPSYFESSIQRIVRLRSFLRKIQREYYSYSRKNDSPLEKISNNITLNYCDGDTPFT
jgi:hypothetical protein